MTCGNNVTHRSYPMMALCNQNLYRPSVQSFRALIYSIFIPAQTQCQCQTTCTRRKKTLTYCPVHHHCGLYLPWNFEKQMVTCKTVMQLARKLRTDSPGTGKLNQICTACNGHKNLCVQQPSNLYSAWSEPWTKICYYHSTVNSSTISRAYVSNFKPTMPEDPRPRPRLKGGRLTYAMLVSA